MNIFVTDESPVKSAQVLPDKHIVKMPLECCQMLSIVASDKWGHGYGTLPKIDGTPYATDKGAFRNHPCTVWANETVANARWLIRHGLALYTFIHLQEQNFFCLLPRVELHSKQYICLISNYITIYKKEYLQMFMLKVC